MNPVTRPVVGLCVFILFAGLVARLPCSMTFAEDKPSEKTKPAFFEAHCLRCHGNDLQEGNFRLDTASSDPESPSFGTVWARAYERINSGEMPPKEESQPNPSERFAAMEWISHGLQAWDAVQNAKREQVSFKRLTREEYVNTLQDLIGYTYHPGDPGGLPEDPSWHGIERLGTILSLTPSHIERAITAAESALQQVMPLSEPPQKWSYEWTAPGIISWSDYQRRLARDPNTPKHRLLIGPANNWKHYVGGLNQIQVPYAGQFRIRIQASGLRPVGGSVPHVVLYDATIDRTLVEEDIDAPEDQPKTIEKLVWLPKGPHDLVLRNELPGPSPYEPHQRGGAVDLFLSLKQGRSPFLEKVTDDAGTPYVPLLILDRFTIESVINPWPPAAQKEILFEGDQSESHAQAIVSRFARRAFRRPATDSEIRRFTNIVLQSQKTGLSFERSVREAILAILCSHEFLFLVEGSSTEHAPQDLNAVPVRDALNDYELASRLSYFLWSTMPDEALLQAAEQGALQQAGVLSSQVDRMLADPRSRRFATDFSRQWLRLKEVGKFPPDKKLYPDFDAGLQRSMVAESQEFFAQVFRENRSLRELIDSDWTMLNNRLASHYGVAGVADFRLKPVQLPEGMHRGGVMTQASILMLTSDGFRHRPVHRGKWISEVIYGVVPPAPPPNAGNIPTPMPDEPKTTLRAKLESHRANPSCAACHAKIDPLGLAFDNYDAIGRWRTNEDSSLGTGDAPAIDASGMLPDGRTFIGPNDFKQCVMRDIDRIALAWTEVLATYALRRGLTFSDMRAVERIVEQSRDDDYRVQSLVKRLIESELFRQR